MDISCLIEYELKVAILKASAHACFLFARGSSIFIRELEQKTYLFKSFNILSSGTLDICYSLNTN